VKPSESQLDDTIVAIEYVQTNSASGLHVVMFRRSAVELVVKQVFPDNSVLVE
jgi:hypothetical protein